MKIINNIGVKANKLGVGVPSKNNNASAFTPFSLKGGCEVTKIANLTPEEFYHIVDSILKEETFAEARGLLDDMLETAEVLGEWGCEPAYLQKGVGILCHMARIGCEGAVQHYVSNELQKRYFVGLRLAKSTKKEEVA